MPSKNRSCLRYILVACLALSAFCLVLALVSALFYNRSAVSSEPVDRLSSLDKARLSEAFHLRKTLGDAVLPGWSSANIPHILYNDEYIFLVGLSNPAVGWVQVPQEVSRGIAWEIVPGDDFFGEPYYRQKIVAPGQNTQAYTVRIGDTWAASMPSLDGMRTGMIAGLRQDTPPFLRPVLPYSLIARFLVPGSDAYVTFLLHESSHAWQGMNAPARLAAAEQAAITQASRYPWQDETFIKNWQTELNILHSALEATSPQETAELARAFLDTRAGRRHVANLAPVLVEFERQREWAEGIARYAERSIFLLVANTPVYTPVPEIVADKEFDGYRRGAQKWDQEVDQLRRMAKDAGDGRFYYTGFAQAVLLDRLSPGWQARLTGEDVWLEDLLAAALADR